MGTDQVFKERIRSLFHMENAIIEEFSDGVEKNRQIPQEKAFGKMIYTERKDNANNETEGNDGKKINNI